MKSYMNLIVIATMLLLSYEKHLWGSLVPPYCFSLDPPLRQCTLHAGIY